MILSLRIELKMRKSFDLICRAHEASLPAVSPKDATGVKEIAGIGDSVKLNGIIPNPSWPQDA